MAATGRHIFFVKNGGVQSAALYNSTADTGTPCLHVVKDGYEQVAKLAPVGSAYDTSMKVVKNGVTYAVQSLAYPPAGTPIGGQYCSGYTLMQNYADGAGGQYAGVVQPNSPTCGWNPPPYGTLLGTYCSGVDLWGTYADGSYGSYAALMEANSVSCGYVAVPRSTSNFDGQILLMPPDGGHPYEWFMGTISITGPASAPFAVYANWYHMDPPESDGMFIGTVSFSGNICRIYEDLGRNWDDTWPAAYRYNVNVIYDSGSDYLITDYVS